MCLHYQIINAYAETVWSLLHTPRTMNSMIPPCFWTPTSIQLHLPFAVPNAAIPQNVGERLVLLVVFQSVLGPGVPVQFFLAFLFPFSPSPAFLASPALTSLVPDVRVLPFLAPSPVPCAASQAPVPLDSAVPWTKM